jgi:hypothetical protein
VPAGAAIAVDVPITENLVVMLYDFFVSIPAKTLIRARIQAIAGVVTATIIEKSGYGSIAKHITRGYPFFETIRFNLYNYGAVDQTFQFGCAGLYTSWENYYLIVSS